MKRFPTVKGLASISQGQTRSLLSVPSHRLEQPSVPRFDDPSILSDTKSRWQLLRALAIFRFCDSKRRVDMSPALLNWSRRLLGERLWRACIRSTIYAQFVGGASRDEMKAVCAHLNKTGILPMILVSLEDPSEQTLDVNGPPLSQRYEENLAAARSCLSLISELTPAESQPQMQIKLTSFLSIPTLEALSKAWMAETDGDPITVPRRLVDHLAWALDTGGEEIGPALKMPSTELSERLRQGLHMLRQVFDDAELHQVRILIDAEHEHDRCGMSAIAYAAALRHNAVRQKSLVWNTFQCYLKHTPQAFDAAVDFHRASGLAFGAKIVRGAYMVQERQRAAAEGLPSPVHNSYEDTSRCYDKVVARLIQLASKGDHKHVTEGIVATHNEASVVKAVERLEELGINGRSKTSPIVFGQIYGMADNISYPLSKAGYRVYKSIPFGGIEDTVPYLVRRAQENATALMGMRRERQLIFQALRAT